MMPTQGNVASERLTFPVTLVVQLVALLHTVGTIRGIRSVLSDGIRGKKESGGRRKPGEGVEPCTMDSFHLICSG